MKVLFNASVILAGLHSPKGASGVLLRRVRMGKLKGEISELIFDEAVRHAKKIGFGEGEMEEKILAIFSNPAKAPEEELIEKYLGLVVDEGDAHVLASCEREGCDTLVSLDKKHLLILKGKVKGLNIVSPGELLLKLKTG
jgi:predicted nucleic acid-binding protein